MSPVGYNLRKRLRMFPAFINCCTMNWINQWPKDALFSVAQMFMQNLEIDDEYLYILLISLL